MSYGRIWSSFTLSRREVARYLQKYSHLLKWKDHKENILEVGCASGTITREVLYPHVKNHLEKLVAVDKSEELINLSKMQNQIDNIEFRIMDITDKEEIEKMNAQYDHIFSFYCTQWITDQRSLIDGFNKMLKHQGQIFLTFFSSTAIMQSFQKQSEEPKWWKYLPKGTVFANYTENPVQYITNLVEDLGFTVDVCELEKKTIPMERFEETVRAVVDIYEHLDLLSPELKEEYFQDHVRASAEFSTYLGPDKYDFPYETILLICSKNT